MAASLLVGIAVSGYFAIEANNERNSALRLAAQKSKLAQEKTKLAVDEIAARIAAGEAEIKERVAREEEVRQRHRAEQLLYLGQIGKAQREWETGNVAAAWEYLELCQWDLRGWEHCYLYTLFNRNQLTFRGHQGKVNSVAFSPDGRRIVSGSADKTLKVWVRNIREARSAHVNCEIASLQQFSLTHPLSP